MIDPGHPFAEAYADVITALEDRLRNGTEQPSTYRFIFQAKVSAYQLPREASAITSVSGSVGSTYTVFAADRDYAFSDNRVVWLGTARALPNDASRVVVEFTYRDPQSGLTDFNEGSVAGTLVRAVAREMTTIYDQMDEAYRRAFIDEAAGVALDSVVALLGVTRVPSQPAEGLVTYLLKAATDKPVTINAGSRVADQQGRTFVTQAAATIAPWTEEVAHQDGGVARTVERIAAVSGVEPGSKTVLGVWPAATTLADPTNPPASLPVLVAGSTPFSDDERTITLVPSAAPLPDPVRIRYRAKSATVAVKAATPGPESNVNADTVTIMPTPPAGVAGVDNEAPLDGGRVAETDDRLRERAKHALERAGNATIGALRFGVLGLEGVDEAEVVDWASDSSLPPGEVRLRISTADQAKVQPLIAQVVDQTRAAGIRVTTDLIQTVMVSGLFILVPDVNPDPAAADNFIAAVTQSIQSLPVGAPLQLRRLNALAFGIAGLADVAEAQLTADGTAVGDPFLVAAGQVVRPDPTHLKAMLLDHLSAADVTTPTGDQAVRLRVLDVVGNVMSIVGTFTLDVTVEVSATLKTSATRTPEVVGTHTEQAVFAGTTDALLAVDPAVWAPNFRPVDHSLTVSVKISATAYPGLVTGSVLVTLPMPKV